MTMPRRAERAILAGVVLLLHLLLWWAWPRGAAPRRGPVDALTQAPLSVRLLTPQPAPTPSAAPAALPAPARTMVPRAPASPPPPPALAVGAAPAASSASAAAAGQAASASAPRDLDLALPPAQASPRSPSLREQWLNDPRSNTPRATVESRIAALNGPDRWQAEPMDATRTRWRRNGKCIEVHVSRNAQIDPYNQSFSPTPKLVKPDCD
jgi:hypothetical protein